MTHSPFGGVFCLYCLGRKCDSDNFSDILTEVIRMNLGFRQLFGFSSLYLSKPSFLFTSANSDEYKQFSQYFRKNAVEIMVLIMISYYVYSLYNK